MSKVAINSCSSYNPDELNTCLEKTINKLGGLDRFIKPQEKILIKPNLLGAHSPEDAVTTHPEFVRLIIKYVKRIGAIPIIGDSPSTMNVAEVYNKTGMKKVADEENVQLINLSTYKVKQVKIDNHSINETYISQYVFDVDGIISLPKLKTHNLTIFTGAVKNFYGLIPGLTKSDYHRVAPSSVAFCSLLSEIYSAIKPKIRLSILDGITGMDGDGPAHGRIRNFDLILASNDAVALDTVVCNLFQINPFKIPMMNDCMKKGLGETNIKNIELLGEDLDKYKIQDPKLPKTHIVNYIPGPIAKIAASIANIKPKIIKSKCKLCMKCVEICPMKVITKIGGETSGGFLKIDYKNCITCFCCSEVCPYGAVELKESIVFKIARRLVQS